MTKPALLIPKMSPVVPGFKISPSIETLIYKERRQYFHMLHFFFDLDKRTKLLAVISPYFRPKGLIRNDSLPFGSVTFAVKWL